MSEDKGMKIQTVLLFVAAIVLAGTLYAQDVIVKKYAEVIPSHVEKVQPEQIEYRKESNLKGPLYVVKRCEVLKK